VGLKKGVKLVNLLYKAYRVQTHLFAHPGASVGDKEKLREERNRVEGSSRRTLRWTNSSLSLFVVEVNDLTYHEHIMNISRTAPKHTHYLL